MTKNLKITNKIVVTVNNKKFVLKHDLSEREVKSVCYGGLINTVMEK